jgi:alpha-1,2-mannosyltransferase
VPGIVRAVETAPRPIESTPSGTRPRQLFDQVRERISSGVLAVTIPAVLCLVLQWRQLATPGLLYSVYDADDGVYFGAAMRITEGLFPYRDFVIVHPPGIAELMLPLAALSHLIGTRDGLALARVLTAMVTVANVVLVGALLRSRPAIERLLGAGALALFPVAVSADNTLLIEPYFVLFSLIGLRLLLAGDELASRRRILLGGAAIGFAGALKIWGAIPAAAFLAYLAWRRRDLLWRYLTGVAAGFVVPCAFFFAAAPVAFVRDVVVSQWLRGRRDVLVVAPTARLMQITGLYGIEPGAPTWWALLGALVAGALLALQLLRHRPRPPLEHLCALALASALLGVFVTHEFYAHYAYWPAAMAAPMIGIALGGHLRDLAGSAAVARLRGRGTGGSRALRAGAVGLVLVATGGLFARECWFSGAYLQASSINDPAELIDSYVPPGSCVVSVDVVYLLVADRLGSDIPGCPALDDSYGTWISLNSGHPPAAPPYSSELVAQWRSWLERAQYLVYEPANVKVPWSPALLGWFNSHYRLLASGEYFQLYVNLSVPPSG